MEPCLTMLYVFSTMASFKQLKPRYFYPQFILNQFAGSGAYFAGCEAIFVAGRY